MRCDRGTKCEMRNNSRVERKGRQMGIREGFTPERKHLKWTLKDRMSVENKGSKDPET